MTGQAPTRSTPRLRRGGAASSISPEADFLTYCCRDITLREPSGVDLRAVAVQDWHRVIAMCESHRIAPLVLSRLENDGMRDRVPESTAGELRILAVSGVALAARLRAALREILLGLAEEGASVIVLKGAALVALVYDDPSLRLSEDIDLLCKEEDFERVSRVLLSQGYRSDDDPTLPRRHSHEETYFERHFFSTDGLVHVELHVDGIKLGVKPKHSESLWESTRRIDVEGAPALALSPDDQVVMLSVHLHRHGFSRLIWFKDIDLIIRRYRDELDWETILAAADAEGAGSSLWRTFRFLDQMFATPVPAWVVRRLRPNLFIRWAFSRIWPEREVLDLKGEAKRRAVQFSVLESLRGTIPSLLLMGRRRAKVKILIQRLLPFS